MALAPLPIMEDKALHQEAPSSPYPVLGATPLAAIETSAPVSAGEEQRMQELERMLQEAQGRAELMEREAYDKAYAAGEKAGMALGAKRAEQSLEHLDVLLQQAESQVRSLSDACNDTVLDIAQAVIEHVLGELGEQRYEMMLASVQRAALEMPSVSDLLLLVSPDDMSVFERLMQEGDIGKWRLRAQSDVPSGCCRLISQQQDIQIDPEQAVKKTIEQLRMRLQGDGDVDELEELV
ncbi:MAG: flagellar assembly protein [Proteobacteria bacterium]|nr:MAG: flagellar assembly protein [Pseudomonadota bacterium]